jgi:hypothetical protein
MRGLQTVKGNIANSLAIVENTPLVITPRVSKTSVNSQIEAALQAYKHDEELARRISSIDNDTSKAGKYTGDTWAAVLRLRELTQKEPEHYAALNEASEDRVRSGLYGAVLKRLGAHRTQRIAAYHAAQLLAAQSAEAESLDHSGE